MKSLEKKSKKVFIIISMMFIVGIILSCKMSTPVPETYTITFNINDGTSNPSTKTQTVQGTNTITLTTINMLGFERMGYDFNSWNTSKDGDGTNYSDGANITVSQNITLYAKWSPKSGIKYTVKHYQQNIENDNYTLVEADTQILTGITDQMTEAIAKSYTGFTAESFSQKKICADGSTVISIYYNRITILLTFYDSEKVINVITGKYGAVVPYQTVPIKQNSIKSSWDKDVQKVFERNEIYIACYTFADESHYTVKHYQQNIEDDNYTLVEADTQILVGKTNEVTNAVPNSYTNFTVQPITQKIISGDESTVVEVYYDRNLITLTFMLNGGEWKGAPLYKADKVYKGKYGAKVYFYAEAIKSGYEMHWSETIQDVYSFDCTYYAIYEPIMVNYTVNYYQQNINNSKYTLYETELKTGLTDTLINSITKEYEGFEGPSFEPETVAGDGSTVIDVYYDRRYFTLTFDANGGHFGLSSPITEKTISVKYGKEVSEYYPKEVYRSGYKFQGFSPSSEFVTKDEKFLAQWLGMSGEIGFYANYDFNPSYESSDKMLKYIVLKHGEINTVPKDLFTRSGYVLIGWSTDKQSEDIICGNGGSFFFDDERNFYAVWRKSIVVQAKEAAKRIREISDTEKYLIQITGTLTPSLKNDITNAIESCPTTVDLDLSECEIVDWQLGDSIDAEKAARVIETISETGTYTVKITGNLTSKLLSNIIESIRHIPGKIILDLSETEGLEVLSGFFGIETLVGIKIPSSVISITKSAWGGAFAGCSSLEFIEIPSSVTSLGEKTFQSCTALKDIKIPSSVTIIPSRLFDGCKSLTTIDIPNSVTEIGDSAFSGTGLTEIKLSDKIIKIGKEAFSSCKQLVSASLPNNITEIPEGLFSQCSVLEEINISSTVNKIGASAFAGTNISSFTIPNGISEIANYAFRECTSLKFINIPDSVTKIGYNAFTGCSALSTILIPDGVTNIEGSLFEGCSSLISVNIPNGVKSIGSKAFYSCTSLKTINISDSVTSIGSSAFAYSGLENINLPQELITIGDNAFEACEKIKSVIIPSSVQKIGKYAFDKCSSISTITFENIEEWYIHEYLLDRNKNENVLVERRINPETPWNNASELTNAFDNPNKNYYRWGNVTLEKR